VAYQQVFAEIVVAVDVVAGQRGLQPGAQFFGEHGVAQALRLADFVVVPGPPHREAPGRHRTRIVHEFEDTGWRAAFL
jgi:hypothetical protein